MNTYKLLVTTATTVLMLGSINTASAEPVMSSYMENALIDVCVAAKSNNTIRFNKTVDSYRLKTKTVALKVVCNGENIADFAANNGAFKTSDKLNDSLGGVSIEDVALNNEKIFVNF